MSTIEIENIGKIKRAIIPYPPEGGIVRLMGTQAVGKSTAQRAINALVTGEGSLEKRDGTISGSVSGLGVTITVKKSTRRTGELEVEAIEGKFSIADLVDPKLADPVAADAKRIKALVHLAGAEADPALFYDLVGGEAEFLRIVGATKETDLLKLAGLVKKKIEDTAREVEASADKAAGSAAALRESASKVTETEAIDPAKLQADLETAIATESALKQAAKSGAELAKNAAEARDALAKAEASYDGKSIEEATKDHDAEVAKLTAAEARVDELLKQLQAAEQEVESQKRAEFQSRIKVDQAKNHVRSLESWRQLIAGAASIEIPDEASIAQAAQTVADSRAAIERQALVRKAIEDRTAAQAADLQYREHATRATRLREAAGKVYGVLSDVVGKLNCPLRVKDGRLVLDTDRGEELFADLSDGQRILIAVPIAVSKMPEHAPLIVEPWLWGELAPASKRLLHETLVERGIVGYAIEATDDPELCAEVFGESNDDGN